MTLECESWVENPSQIGTSERYALGPVGARIGSGGAEQLSSLADVALSAVLFDIGGVLEIVEEPLWIHDWTDASLDDLDSRLGYEPSAPALGHVDEAGMRAAYRDALDLSESEVDLFMAQMWNWYCGALDRPLFDWATSLSGLSLGILSNSADGARREEETRYGFSLVFDPVLYSHEIGLAKPDPAVFTYACERLGCSPTEVLFVDDVSVNVAAARKTGMQAILHRSTPETIAEAERILRASKP